MLKDGIPDNQSFIIDHIHFGRVVQDYLMEDIKTIINVSRHKPEERVGGRRGGGSSMLYRVIQRDCEL